MCLSPEAGKTTTKDEQFVIKLESLIPDVDVQKVFDGLQHAKTDVSGMCLFVPHH